MAQIDYAQIANEKAMVEAYEKMQGFLQSKKGKKEFPEWLDFVRYLNKQEVKIHKQAEEIESYKEFFGKLSSFLPRKFSVHDVLH
jgi:hypothetical protein